MRKSQRERCTWRPMVLLGTLLRGIASKLRILHFDRIHGKSIRSRRFNDVTRNTLSAEASNIV